MNSDGDRLEIWLNDSDAGAKSSAAFKRDSVGLFTVLDASAVNERFEGDPIEAGRARGLQTLLKMQLKEGMEEVKKKIAMKEARDETARHLKKEHRQVDHRKRCDQTPVGITHKNQTTSTRTP